MLSRFQAAVRQRLKELKTIRGVAFLLVTLAVMALFMMQSALPEGPVSGLFPIDAQQTRKELDQFLSLGVLAAFLLTVFISPAPGLYFSPAEINLLFSGPFTRRALLLYKLGCYGFGVLLSSLLIMLVVVMTPKPAYPPQAIFLGTFLTLMFIQLLTVTAGLLWRWLKNRCSVRIGIFLVILPALLLAAAGWHDAGTAGGLKSLLAQFQSSPAGALILAPFDVFAHITLAQSVYPDLLLWSSLGLALNLGLVAVIVRLDRLSGEDSTVSSLERHQRWARARRSGLLWGAQPVIVRSLRHPPVLGGIGPIAWRQMLSAFRSSSRVLLTFLGMAVCAGPLLVLASADVSRWSLLGGVFCAAVFVLPRALVFDYRSDLETIESLKSLPVAPWKIGIGQLATPVVLSSLIELVLMVSTAMLLDSRPRTMLIGMSPFLLPFNLLLYGLENLFFLLFPAPLVPVGRADFDFLGRTLAGFVVTSTVLIGSCFLAAAAGQAAVVASGWTWPGFVAAAWLTLALIALMMLPLLSWAFNRFDVGR
ncbi:MAG: hypothetical protein ACU841_17505 [Gammaproteobacteria bacterium]